MADDTRLLQVLTENFAIYCDENDLSVEAGEALAEKVSEEIHNAADDRRNYADTEDNDG